MYQFYRKMSTNYKHTFRFFLLSIYFKYEFLLHLSLFGIEKEKDISVITDKLHEKNKIYSFLMKNLNDLLL